MAQQAMSVRTRAAAPKEEEKPAVAVAAPPAASAMSTALATTANLAKVLPTGTLVAFQILTPIFTNNGDCDGATRALTVILLGVLCLSCFVASFTDSVAASDGRIYYGLATFRGLLLFERPPPRAVVPDLAPFRIALVDCIHALLSAVVFAVVAVRDRNVVTCLYPNPESAVREVLGIAPLGVGLLCSFVFLTFPTTRHGIGYPRSPVPSLK